MPDPMYRQIAEDLRHKIESGELAGGSQLPTELELRDQYEASRNTVRDAIRLLATRGLIETRPGQGTFVVEKIDPFVTILTGDPEDTESLSYSVQVKSQRRTPTLTEPRVEIQQATGVIASELELDHGSTVVSRHQRRLIDATPWSLQTSFYPMSLAERGAMKLIQAPDITDGAVAYLGEQLGLKQVGYRDKITVRAPDANETAFFRLPDDGRVAVFETFRTAFDESDKPFRLTVTVYPTDRNQFVMNVGRVAGENTSPAGRSPAETGTRQPAGSGAGSTYQG
jgi:GntR family transcriptional regulator